MRPSLFIGDGGLDSPYLATATGAAQRPRGLLFVQSGSSDSYSSSFREASSGTLSSFPIGLLRMLEYLCSIKTDQCAQTPLGLASFLRQYRTTLWLAAQRREA